jgi:hypothetical protein
MLMLATAMVLAGTAPASAAAWTVERGENGSCTMHTVSETAGTTRDLRFRMDRFGKTTVELRRSDWKIQPRSLAVVNFWFGKPTNAPSDGDTYWFSLKDDVTGLEGQADDAFVDRIAASKTFALKDDVLKIDEMFDTTGAAAAVERLRACAG